MFDFSKYWCFLLFLFLKFRIHRLFSILAHQSRNFTDKIISNTVANRLSSLLPKIISLMQSGFVQGFFLRMSLWFLRLFTLLIGKLWEAALFSKAGHDESFWSGIQGLSLSSDALLWFQLFLDLLEEWGRWTAFLLSFLLLWPRVFLGEHVLHRFYLFLCSSMEMYCYFPFKFCRWRYYLYYCYQEEFAELVEFAWPIWTVSRQKINRDNSGYLLNSHVYIYIFMWLVLNILLTLMMSSNSCIFLESWCHCKGGCKYIIHTFT